MLVNAMMRIIQLKVKNRNINYIYHILFKFSSHKTHYELLGVGANFTKQELRKCFLKKAKACHPDFNPSKDAEEEFKAVKEAYETLKNTHKRYLYDTGISLSPEDLQNRQRTQRPKTAQQNYYSPKYDTPNAKPYDSLRKEYENRIQNSQKLQYNQKIKTKIKFVILMLSSILLYDLAKSLPSKRERTNKQARRVLQESTPTDSRKQQTIRQYIQNRSALHRAE